MFYFATYSLVFNKLLNPAALYKFINIFTIFRFKNKLDSYFVKCSKLQWKSFIFYFWTQFMREELFMQTSNPQIFSWCNNETLLFCSFSHFYIQDWVHVTTTNSPVLDQFSSRVVWYLSVKTSPLPDFGNSVQKHSKTDL